MPAIGTDKPTKSESPAVFFNGYWDASTNGTQYDDENLNSAHLWDKGADATLYAQYIGYSQSDLYGAWYAMQFDAHLDRMVYTVWCFIP